MTLFFIRHDFKRMNIIHILRDEFYFLFYKPQCNGSYYAMEEAIMKAFKKCKYKNNCLQNISKGAHIWNIHQQRLINV